MKSPMVVAIVSLLCVAGPALADTACAKVYQGKVSVIDPINKRVTLVFNGGQQMIPTSNATTIDEAPNFNTVTFSAIKLDQLMRICVEERGFATSMTIGNACAIVEGNVVSLDQVNKRFTLSLPGGATQMIPTSNATQILVWATHSATNFAALAVGKDVRACTDRGFAVSAAIMN